MLLAVAYAQNPRRLSFSRDRLEMLRMPEQRREGWEFRYSVEGATAGAWGTEEYGIYAFCSEGRKESIHKWRRFCRPRNEKGGRRFGRRGRTLLEELFELGGEHFPQLLLGAIMGQECYHIVCQNNWICVASVSDALATFAARDGGLTWVQVLE